MPVEMTDTFLLKVGQNGLFWTTPEIKGAFLQAILSWSCVWRLDPSTFSFLGVTHELGLQIRAGQEAGNCWGLYNILTKLFLYPTCVILTRIIQIAGVLSFINVCIKQHKICCYTFLSLVWMHYTNLARYFNLQIAWWQARLSDNQIYVWIIIKSAPRYWRAKSFWWLYIGSKRGRWHL